MLGWIWKAVCWIFSFGDTFTSRRQNKHREIFHFWDGQKFRSIDPLKVWRELDAHPQFRMDLHPEALDAGDSEAWAVTVQAVRDVFGVPVMTENSGLTESECLDLLKSFALWVNALKKNINLPRISRGLAAEKSCDGSGESREGAGAVPGSPVDLEAEFLKVASEVNGVEAAEALREKLQEKPEVQRPSHSPANTSATSPPPPAEVPTTITPTNPLSAFGSTSTESKPADHSPSSPPSLQPFPSL